MGRVILDSSVLIASASTSHVHFEAARQSLSQRHHYAISVITLSEILVPYFAQGEVIGRQYRSRLLKDISQIVDTDQEVAVLASQIRAESGIKIPDALISATAAVHKLELWTFDKQLAKATKGARLLK